MPREERGIEGRFADERAAQTVPLQGKDKDCPKIVTINIAPTLSGSSGPFSLLTSALGGEDH